MMSSPPIRRSIPLGVDATPDLEFVAGASIDLDAPRLGIVCGDTRLLGLDLRATCTAGDHWIRGGDVVAVYEPHDPREMRTTALWRRRQVVAAAAWELIASATTSRERSDVSLAVVSDVAAGEILWGVADHDRIRWEHVAPAAADCVLLRRPATPAAGSVLLAGHPADTRHLVTRTVGGRVHVECWLFPTVAEKGVLFRGRALAAIGPAAGDLHWAERAYGDFVSAPPMLTA